MISTLVVDDDFMVAKLHAAFVERTPGFKVVRVVHTGADALRAVHELPPDLVLLDIYLPDRAWRSWSASGPRPRTSTCW
jgi:response regulator of citrate/malate metabolism